MHGCDYAQMPTITTQQSGNNNLHIVAIYEFSCGNEILVSIGT